MSALVQFCFPNDPCLEKKEKKPHEKKTNGVLLVFLLSCMNDEPALGFEMALPFCCHLLVIMRRTTGRVWGVRDVGI